MKPSKVLRRLIFLCLPVWLLSQNHVFSQGFEPGTTYFDTTNLVEYFAGNLPLIISAPHGGYLEPDTIPDRDCTGCVYVRDSFTQEIGRDFINSFHELTGHYPHVIINLLDRVKFDANRDLGEATGGNEITEQVWHNYHAFIDSAKKQVLESFGSGLFLDLHGHGHEIQRIELGYLLSKSELQLSNTELNDLTYISESSIRGLAGAQSATWTHSQLLRGEFSFGSLMNQRGFPSVPSSTDQSPADNEPYFSGGYNTQRYGSREGGTIDAIQLEFNSSIRFDTQQRALLVQALTEVSTTFLNTFYDGNYGNLLSSDHEVTDTKFDLFPNPTDGWINIQSEASNLHVELRNLVGQSLGQYVWLGHPLDFRFLNNGYYFLIVIDEKSMKKSIPFVVKKK